MKSVFTPLLFICSVLLLNTTTAQTVNIIDLNKTWNAHWISAKNETGRDYGVFYFRKRIDLPAKPAKFIVNVSADNRYKLYVNGTLVSLGPARGDTYYWNYEKVDLAPYLVAGKNTAAAIVWNEAEERPEAQISLRTAFIIQGNTTSEEVLNTDNTWKGIRDKAYRPLTGIGYPAYYVAGPGELVDESKTIKGWMANDYNDSAWLPASAIDKGKPKGIADAFGWMLVPSILPQMERTYQRIPVLRKYSGFTLPASFPATKTAIFLQIALQPYCWIKLI